MEDPLQDRDEIDPGTVFVTDQTQHMHTLNDSTDDLPVSSNGENDSALGFVMVQQGIEMLNVCVCFILGVDIMYGYLLLYSVQMVKPLPQRVLVLLHHYYHKMQIQMLSQK